MKVIFPDVTFDSLEVGECFKYQSTPDKIWLKTYPGYPEVRNDNCYCLTHNTFGLALKADKVIRVDAELVIK